MIESNSTCSASTTYVAKHVPPENNWDLKCTEIWSPAFWEIFEELFYPDIDGRIISKTLILSLITTHKKSLHKMVLRPEGCGWQVASNNNPCELPMTWCWACSIVFGGMVRDCLLQKVFFRNILIFISAFKVYFSWFEIQSQNHRTRIVFKCAQYSTFDLPFDLLFLSAKTDH